MNALLYLMLNPAAAPAADCPYLSQAVRMKLEQLETQTTRNETVLVNLLDTEKKCETRGAELSLGLAARTEGDACAVQGEYSKLSLELHELGAKCTENLSSLHGIERGVRAEFEAASADLEESFRFMLNDIFLVRACGREINETKKLRREFAALDVRIASVETRARDGVSNYGKFQARTGTLSQDTGARATRCQSNAAGSLVASAAAGAAPAPVPAGRSPRAASDITGLKPEPRLESGAAEKFSAVGATSTAIMVETREARSQSAAPAITIEASSTQSQVSAPAAAPEAARELGSVGALFFGELPSSEGQAPRFDSAFVGGDATIREDGQETRVLPSDARLLAALSASVPAPRPTLLAAGAPADRAIADRNASLFRRVSARYRSLQAVGLAAPGKVRWAGR